MWFSFHFTWLLFSSINLASDNNQAAARGLGKYARSSFDNELQLLLSLNATIVHDTTGAPRWSEFDAPTPGTIVNVATEHDVQITVRITIFELLL